MTTRRSLRGALALAAGSVSVSSKPLTEIRAIEGKWRGTITVGNGVPHSDYLTVHPDSTIVTEWGPNWSEARSR